MTDTALLAKPDDALVLTPPSRIVVIDDDDALREIISLALTAEGYVVSTARNGAEGLELLAQHETDGVIVDMKMPIMDGAEFCRTYAQRVDRPAPVIVLTAAPAASSEDFQVPGAAATIAKPFDLDALLEAVARLVGRPGTEPA